MNTVFVLMALVYNGHFLRYAIPTLEFTTMKKCQDAIVVMQKDINDRSGRLEAYCVGIEK